MKRYMLDTNTVSHLPAMRELLKRVDVLPWDSATAERYGPVRADMERQDRILGPLDLLIAT